MSSRLLLLRYGYCLLGISTEAGSSPGTTFPCLADSSSTDTTTTIVLYKCGTKKSKKRFENGQALVFCSSDSDCKLADGTNTIYTCVLNSEDTGVLGFAMLIAAMTRPLSAIGMMRGE